MLLIIHPIAQTRSGHALPALQSCTKLGLLERVPHSVILPQHHLPLLLRRDMLHPDLLCHLIRELPDEARVPEVGGDAKVFAGAHQGVGLAAFGGGRDAVGVEVLLFAAGD